jgi:hypothetical protein
MNPELLDPSNLVASFRQGSSAMAVNAIDFYTNPDGGFIKHEWAMGGQSTFVVPSVPDVLPGYKLLS